jgi:hypothetical protein
VTPAPTYALEGDAYTEVASAASSPPGRGAFALASFPSQSKVVVFGGRKRQGVLFDDTWTWNGATWKLEAPAHRPPARVGATLVEDPNTKRLVLFGGSDERTPFLDLWEWDGSDWTARPVSTEYPASPWGGLLAAPLPSRAPAQGQGLVAVLDPLAGAGWTYQGGTFKRIESAVPRISGYAGAFGGLALNEARGTLEAFIPSDGRTLAYEGRASEGRLVFTSLAVPLASDLAMSAAYDTKRKSAVVFAASRAVDLGWKVVPNQAPTLDVPLFPQVFAEDTLTFQASAKDADDAASTLRLKAEGLPAGATFDATTRTFSWRPTPAQRGTHVVKLTASDGKRATSRDVTVEVLWHTYPMLQAGPVDLLTSGAYIDSFTRWPDADRRMLGGLFDIPSFCEHKDRFDNWRRDACPWPYGTPMIACRFTGKNPGKVVASCVVNKTGAQGDFVSSATTLPENGAFDLGALVTIANEGPAMQVVPRLYPINEGYRIVQTATATSLLRPMPTR